jgi:heme-degrading monooxygenase HmoA
VVGNRGRARRRRTRGRPNRAYETLIEKARASATNAREAMVLRSRDDRRVIALLRLDGHESFRHLASAWDDHHLVAEGRAIAESRSLALYRLSTTAGDPFIDPASTDAYAFERVARSGERVRAVAALLAGAPGFRGTSFFGTDDDRASAIVYRFTHAEEIEAFRATPEAQGALGAVGGPGEALYPVYAVRTFDKI